MSADADRIDVVNPATEEVLDSLPLGSAAEVDAAVERAWNAADPEPESALLHVYAEETDRQ